jgi:hypothetical protein
MTTSPLFRVLGAACGLWLVPIQAARACSQTGVRSVTNLTTLPLEGSTAPPNTKLWRIAAPGETGEYSLENGTGVAVALQRSTITISGEEAVDLEMLTPLSLLDAGSWVFSRGATVLSRFTVSGEVDESPPPALSPAITNVEGAYFGAWSCGQPSTLTLALGADAGLAIAVHEGQPWPATAVLGVASGSSLEIASPAEGDQRLVVFQLDLAGNATPSSVVRTSIPVKTNGCSVGAIVPMGLLALALLRRRSRG